MTKHKHFKDLVRSRMKKTGERYAAARRQVIAASAQGANAPRSDRSGSIPATTALGVLLNHAGVGNPHTGRPFTEAMLFGVAGGIGIGVFSFLYEKADFASFFIAGRHLWHDDLAYLQSACKRLDVTANVRESSSAKAADKQLRAALTDGQPCIAWVDAASLPHRAMPAHMSGGGYHVINIFSIDDAAGTARIGDLTDEPIDMPLSDLATARARIKKQKNRLLTLGGAKATPDLRPLVREGLRACHAGLRGEGGVKSAKGNFSLDVLAKWAKRLHGTSDKESWEHMFPPGKRLWMGLTSVYDFIEHYGTGGGLCRPIFAEYLAEAAAALKDDQLKRLAQRYAVLGNQWSALADAALPDSVPLFKKAKALLDAKAESMNSGSGAEDVRAAWQQLDDLATHAKAKFPLTDAECAELRKGLQERVLALLEGERAAHEALAEAASS
jgi:hypothetical protein